MTSGVYCILNLVTSERYVGSSNNLDKRRRYHLSSLANGKHPNTRLRASCRKHGAKAFMFGVIEDCDPDRLAERESHWVGHYRPAFNIPGNYTARQKTAKAAPTNLNFGVPIGTVARVEAYRERERLESRGAACRRIIEAGLKSEGLL